MGEELGGEDISEEDCEEVSCSPSLVSPLWYIEGGVEVVVVLAGFVGVL